MTQEELANILGVEQSYISRVELGKENLSLRTIEQIAPALGVKPEQICNPQPLKQPRR